MWFKCFSNVSVRAAGINWILFLRKKENPEILNELYAGEAYRTGNIGRMAEQINPAGTRTYRRGMYFLMMYEKGIKIKKFGGSPAEMSWEEFLRITQEIFENDAAGSRTYENHFGIIVDQTDMKKRIPSDFAPAQKKFENTKAEEDFQKPEEERKPEQLPEAGKKEEEDAQNKEIQEKTTQNEEVQEESAQNKEIQKEDATEEQIPGQMEMTKDMPEYCPPFINPPETTESEPPKKTRAVQQETTEGSEEPEKVYGSRKQYLDTLTEYAAALYLAASLRSMKSLESLTETEYWEKWLKAEVDERGEEIEVVE